MASDHIYAANALHVLLRGRLPGWRPGEEEDAELRDELEYAGELMVVQFFALIRTFLGAKK